MDFDKAPPMPVSEYRRTQGIIPGIDALYSVIRAILDVSPSAGAEILIVGAGGGREVEALVMHFLPDDGPKAAYLRAIRARLRSGAPYLHVDVSLADRATFDRLAPVMTGHALLLGFPENVATKPAELVGQMAFDGSAAQLISKERTLFLLRESGFRSVAPFFRGMWFAGWWAEAV